MRALGPGSVSSFLKIILDVIYVGLWVWVSLLAICSRSRAAAQLQSRTDHLETAYRQLVDELISKGTAVRRGAGRLGAAVRRLDGDRRAPAQDLLHPDRRRPVPSRQCPRLRVVGLVLAALEVGHYIFAAMAKWLAPDTKIIDGSFSLTAWFPVLVVFVLAEVFREGARLRREAELTI
jgi:hypothetical protein